MSTWGWAGHGSGVDGMGIGIPAPGPGGMQGGAQALALLQVYGRAPSGAWRDNAWEGAQEEDDAAGYEGAGDQPDYGDDYGDAYGDYGEAASASPSVDLQKVGGKSLFDKVRAIGKKHGKPTADAFARHAKADPVLRDNYTVREHLIGEAKASPKDEKKVAVAKRHARKVHAAENMVLHQILRGAKPRTPPRVGYRDAQGKGGWIYRQYADGVIVILRDPRQGGPSRGARLHEGDAWRAITDEIGPFPQGEVEPLAGGRHAVPTAALRVAAGSNSPFVADAVKVGTAALVAGRAGAKMAPGVSALLTAAGVSASAPIVGWITAGGLALGAGTVALVFGLRHRRHDKKQTIALARKLGMGKDAEAVPGFTVRAFRMSADRREKVLKRLAAHVERGKGADSNKRERQRHKLRILATVHLADRAEKRKRGMRVKAQVKLRGFEGLPPSGTFRRS